MTLYFRCLIIIFFGLLTACSENASDKLVASSFYQFSQVPVISADLSVDTKFSLLLDVEQQLTFWDNNSKELVRQWHLTSEKEQVYHAVLAKNNEVIATASKHFVSLYSVKSGKKVSSWKIQGFDSEAQITSLLLNNSGSKVFIGLNEGSVIVADLKKETRSIYQIHSTTVNHLLLLNDGETMLSGAHDSKVVNWNIYTGQNAWQAEQRFRVTSLAIDKNQKNIFISDALKSQQVIALTQGSRITNLKYLQRFRTFRQAIFIDRYQQLLTASSKSQLSLWDIKSGEQLKSGDIRAYTFGSTVLDFAENEEGSVLSLSSDGVLEEWPANNFR